MARPYGLLRAGFPYIKTLGMRRITNFPVDIALGNDERIYVLCRQENAVMIRKYNYMDEDLGSIGGWGTDEGQFQWPVALIADANENLFVSDEALHRITQFDSEGEMLATWGEHGSNDGQFNRPTGLSFDLEGNILVVDSMNHRVQKFTRDGKYISKFGSHGTGEGEFESPWGITVDELGDIYVADWGNDRVQKFDANGGFILAFGNTGSDDGQFNRPTDIAVDLDGDIYVADWGNNRVQLFNSEPRYVQQFQGEATLSQIAREYMMTNASPNRLRDMAKLEPQRALRRPKAVVLGEDGRMYVADTDSYRLQVYQKEVIPLDSTQIAPPMRSPTLHQE
ncbi:MAG: NHL repeat-containing protein [Dehalococcoidia bacterium]